jgi:oxygen-dependent protoporphyrinogen oxidase
MIAALAAGIDDCEIRAGTTVVALRRTRGRYELALKHGPSIEADAVVLATPAFAAAELVESLSPAIAETLREIPYADVATLTLAYPPEALTRPLDASGFLVPPAEGRLLVGCTWTSVKWPHLAERPVVLLRCLVGRHQDRRWMSLTDDALVRQVHDELVCAMGVAAQPRNVHIQRWPQALPQYTVGHADRLERIDTALRQLPGLWLTGAAYRGVGLAGCVTQAQHAVDAIAADLAALHTQKGVLR